MGIAGTFFAFVVTIFILPESPKFLYLKNRFDESRQALSFVAKFNNLNFDTKFIFDTENNLKLKGELEEENLMSREVSIIIEEISDS